MVRRTAGRKGASRQSTSALFRAYRRSEIAQLIATFLLGALLGSTATLWSVGSQVDTLIAERNRLEAQAAALRSDLDRVNKSLQERRVRPIRSVAVEVTLPVEDPDQRLSVERQLRELLVEFVGREVGDVDPEVVERVVERRILPVSPHPLMVRVRSVQVWDTLRVRVEAERAFGP